MFRNKLLTDTAVMTFSGLLLRVMAMVFQVWLVSRIGEAGIGLFTLVGSVNALCATFAISGIRFTATRLSAEELGLGAENAAIKAVRCCLYYGMFFGLSAMVVLFSLRWRIALVWIGSAEVVESLEVIALRMPFISMSSVLNGYLISRGKAIAVALVQTVEQLSCMGFVFLLLSRISGGIGQACAAVCLGGTMADILSAALSLVIFFFDIRNCERDRCCVPIARRMLKLALPLAFSAYARTSLSTLQNMLVPKKLRQSGMTADASLAGYGVVCGMVFPIIYFPSCVLGVVSELIVPELTRKQVRGESESVKRTVRILLSRTLMFSLTFAAFFFLCGDALGYFIYKSDSAGRYIRIFSLLVPIMYMDMVTDGCLKGLGHVTVSMCYNVAESVMGVILVVLLLPRFGLAGFIFSIFACEVFNFALSLNKLIKTVKHPA